MENKDSIQMWIMTSNNICKTMNLAMEKNDTDVIIELLNQFKEATHQLETLLIIEKEDRFTA